MFICIYFPFSRFGIRLCSFVPTFRFLGLELSCSFVPIFHFLGLELGCVCLYAYFPFSRFGIRLCSFVPVVFSVWN